MLSDLDILPGESGSLPGPLELGLRLRAQRGDGGKACLGHAPGLPTRVSTPPRLLKQTEGIGCCPVHTRGETCSDSHLGLPKPPFWKGPDRSEAVSAAMVTPCGQDGKRTGQRLPPSLAPLSGLVSRALRSVDKS